MEIKKRSMLLANSALYFTKNLIVFFLATFCMMAQGSIVNTANNYTFLSNKALIKVPPSVMILMSRHHSLFKLAYVDSVDINNDGIIDTGYLDTIEYTGYFNSAWCYQYDSGKSYFAPVSLATGPNNHHCDTSTAPWSGNFLNWATMTRADIVRLAFYGGKRVIDTASETVLERAALTSGTDSFAKVYNQPDIKKYTPYNHTTSFCNTQREEPLLMVAPGSYPRWALSEGIVQCSVGIASTPESTLNVFQHRVAVCVQGKDASDLERCKSYGTSSSKPVGLLQNYGEGGGVLFGLMDTSVTNNGAQLRANIRNISDEINPYNGTFTSTNGVIYHMNAVEMNPGFKGYHPPPKVTGNSIAEAYSEALRYFAGQTTPRTDFQPTREETTRLYTPAWKPPLTENNSCSDCSIIVVSSTDPSYDTDHMAYSYNLPNLNSFNDIKTFTNAVGNHESKYTFPGSFVHSNAGGSICRNQPLSSLSELIGLCPSEAGAKGGYYGAGLAYYANTTDLLPSLPGKQSIKTYVLQMETPVPFISVPVGSTNKVLISPVCSYCRYRQMRVENIASDGRSGSFYFVWADRDYDYIDDNDFDAASRISYCVADVCTPSVGANQVQITVEHAGKNTSGNPNFSYSVDGTTNDGINPSYTTESSSYIIINDGEGTPISTTYTVSSSSPTILPSPLWLMAKYGGFNDLDSDGSPNYSGTVFSSNDEWDKLNNATGVIGGDGVPDNYLLARQPNLIKNYLSSVLQNVVTRHSAGANVSILAKNNQGTGMVVQPLFRMNETINGKELSWIGLLNAYFIDDNGFIREDSNKNAKIDSTDFYLEFSFDAAEGKTLAQRNRLASDGKTLIPEGSRVDVRELKTLWSAHEALLDLRFHVVNRVYHDKAEYARYMFTWLDSNNDGAVHNNEIKSFDVRSALESELDANLGGGGRFHVLLYTMGEDLFSVYVPATGAYTSLRSRSVDDDGDGRTEVWKLGDIINSTPVSVAEPQGLYGDSRGYDRSDQTFLDFKSHYNDRRTMVYVGANDGLLHAFNAGFWDAPNQQFLTSRSGKTAHALGTELWAYAPMNLLPHYQWLTSLQYQHIPYMDGSGQVFDVNIFADDADHPGGWGTILVMGMGFGGGDIDITLASGTVTRRSAYVVLDITNPEKPPVLLAELTHPELGFTTMKPALVRKRKPSALGYSSPSVNDWYLVFGSGPKTATVRNTLNTVSSTQNLKVFVYDLNNKSWVTGWDPLDTGIASSYSGDMTVADWNEDYSDDVLYFGSVNTASSTLGGQLNRIDMISDDPSSWRFSTFVDIGRPIVEAPLLVKDTAPQHWVYAGTGRDIIASDRADSSQEYSFGVKEPLNSSGGFAFSEVSSSDLVDTTDVVMSADGTFASPLSIRAGNIVNSFSALEMAMNAEKGWINKLQTSGSKPSAKRSGRMTSFYTSILSVDYVPPEEICEVEGNSFLNAQHYKTGTAIPSNIRRILTSTTTDSTKTVALGKGKVDGLNDLYTDSSGNSRILTQGEAGNLTSTIIDMTANNVTSPPSPTFRLGERESWQQIYNIPR